MKRVLENANKRQIYTKSRNHNETCSRDYNSSSAGTLPREIRKQVLPDYDSIDMDSSHVNCMIAVCRARGLEVPQILIDVVMQKKEIRQRIADEEGVTMTLLKPN